MRTEFVESATKEDALERCPWAAVIIEVDGGWMAFESTADYEVWLRQS